MIFTLSCLISKVGFTRFYFLIFENENFSEKVYKHCQTHWLTKKSLDFQEPNKPKNCLLAGSWKWHWNRHSQSLTKFIDWLLKAKKHWPKPNRISFILDYMIKDNASNNAPANSKDYLGYNIGRSISAMDNRGRRCFVNFIRCGSRRKNTSKLGNGFHWKRISKPPKRNIPT